MVGDDAAVRLAVRGAAHGKAYRCIVPDHVGMGLSDKPSDRPGASPRYDYTLQSRVDDLTTLLERLDITGPVTLVVHDWGGMIGIAWALRHVSQVVRLVVLNTAMFPLPGGKPLPWQLWLGRDTWLGGFAIRAFNAFSSAASFLGVEKNMPPGVRRAYVAPYGSWSDRIATLRFVQDIPLLEADPAMPLVAEAGRRLGEFAGLPVFIGWGLRDFVFDQRCLDVFRRAWPNAEVHAFADAGHYVLEDEHAMLVPGIRNFLDMHPLPPAG